MKVVCWTPWCIVNNRWNNGKYNRKRYIAPNLSGYNWQSLLWNSLWLSFFAVYRLGSEFFHRGVVGFYYLRGWWFYNEMSNVLIFMWCFSTILVRFCRFRGVFLAYFVVFSMFCDRLFVLSGRGKKKLFYKNSWYWKLGCTMVFCLDAEETSEAVCAGCLNVVDDEEFISALGQEWHMECFRLSSVSAVTMRINKQFEAVTNWRWKGIDFIVFSRLRLFVMHVFYGSGCEPEEILKIWNVCFFFVLNIFYRN